MTKMMIKLAIIGCGRISYKHLQAAAENRNSIKLVAVCDLIATRAEQRANEFFKYTQEKVLVYTDYQKMLEEQDIDVVAICTESGLHASIAIFSMQKRKHVIVEKPMALSISETDEMIINARNNDVKLCVSHQNRFNPPIQKLRKAIEDGRFGKIIACDARILWNRKEDYYREAAWRGTYAHDGGCLMNQCIHNIDLLQWMVGDDIKWVHGEVDNFIHPYIEAEDYGSIQIRFCNGTIGNVEGTTCIYPRNLEETLTVIGERGTVVIGGLAVNKVLTWQFYDGLDKQEEVIKECNREIDSVYGNGHVLLYKDMIEAVMSGREPYINGKEGKKAIEIILAAYQSSRENRRISFPIKGIKSIDFVKERKNGRL